jgi:hypothetical protein
MYFQGVMKKSSIQQIGTGLIYKNPAPHVHSLHAYFPSVVSLDNGEMLATVVLGEAFEAPNLRTHVCRSTDGGETWALEGALAAGVKGRLTSNCARLTALPNGELVVFMIRHDRTDHPHEGLTNPKTLGFVPTELLLIRSLDYGRSWSTPKTLTPPLVGPSFEMCSPITPLQDGRWLLPTLTWPGWQGQCSNGVKMIALVSPDRGRTWPEYLNVMREPKGRVFFWESKIVEFQDRTLLALAWAYDDKAAKDRPNQYVISRQGGKSWSAPRSTGLQGQTLTPFLLADGRILCVYRRMDKPGLWANISHLKGDRWVNDDELPLWGTQVGGLTSRSKNMAQNFQVLKFGAPSITRAPDGTILVAFWGYEEGVSVIRWFKLKIR